MWSFVQACYRLATLSLVLVTIMIVAWLIDGHQIASVQTGSMVPTFYPGDGIIIRRVPATALRVGDIVSYRLASNSRIIESHRIIAKTAQGDYITRGDHVKQADPVVMPKQIIGRVDAVLPGWGRLMHWLQRPAGLTVVVYIPAAVICAAEVFRYQRVKRPRRYQLQQA